MVNVTEDPDNYYVRAELPGVKTDELGISVTGDTLTLSGERKLLEESEQASYHRREREAGSFSRVISLPSRLDVDKVKAHAEDGVLTVRLQRPNRPNRDRSPSRAHDPSERRDLR